jgi:hypothetical protein
MKETFSRRSVLQRAGVVVPSLLLTGCVGKAKKSERPTLAAPVTTPESIQQLPQDERFVSPHFPYSILLPNDWERTDASQQDYDGTFLTFDDFRPKNTDEKYFPRIDVIKQHAYLGETHDLNDYVEQTKLQIEASLDELNYASEIDVQERSIAGYQAFLVTVQAPQYEQPMVINDNKDTIFLVGDQLWNITLTSPHGVNIGENVADIYTKALESFTLESLN